jgi:osmoprotectant transport system permease protein
MDTPLNFSLVWTWLNDPANWHDSASGPGVLTYLREHIVYSLIAVIIALLIALPLGLIIGHTGRGVVVVAGAANSLRAIPTYGLLVLLVVWMSPAIHVTGEISGLVPRGGLPYLIPTEIVLVLMAIPPILTSTYAGVQNIDPEVRDAASGMGMTGSQVVRKVELPCALPLIFSGLRSATLQVIATATVAAYFPVIGGLGRLLLDGLTQLNDPHNGYPKMVSGAILVALLAVAADLVLIGLQRLTVSPGVSGRFSRRRARPVTFARAEVEAA